MAPAQPVKILVAGDVRGRFASLARRVESVHGGKSGPFEMLLCVGEFFGPDQEANAKVTGGQIEFALPTYILGPTSPSTSAAVPGLEDSAEFSANLTYLGRRGILNTASGLTLAYLSGVEGETANAFQFNVGDVDELLLPVRAQSGFLGVDILVTSIWPAEVAKYALNTPQQNVDGSTLLSRLAAGLKPRYHFAGGAIHYERQPYRNHRILLEPSQHVTRFIGLAEVDNPEKSKWLYAFSMVPISRMARAELVSQPPNTSEFPYLELLQDMTQREKEEALATRGDHQRTGGQFFFDTTEPRPEEEDEEVRAGRKRHRRGDRGGGGGDEKRAPPAPCWFCLANAGSAQHLVVSVGSSCYAAMPKGPLVDDHVMILTIEHVQSLVAASEAMRGEVEKYKNAFTLAADKVGKVIVSFERNYRSQHMQVQLVPIPKKLAKMVKSAFVSAALEHKMELTTLGEKDQIWDLVPAGAPYFFAELPDGTRLFTRNINNTFPLQFGREVLASAALLNCEDKIDWRACALDESAETTTTQALQKRFRPFDFTDDD